MCVPTATDASNDHLMMANTALYEEEERKSRVLQAAHELTDSIAEINKIIKHIETAPVQNKEFLERKFTHIHNENAPAIWNNSEKATYTIVHAHPSHIDEFFTEGWSCHGSTLKKVLMLREDIRFYYDRAGELETNVLFKDDVLQAKLISHLWKDLHLLNCVHIYAKGALTFASKTNRPIIEAIVTMAFQGLLQYKENPLVKKNLGL
jgi:hypothetical protein